MNVSRRDFFAVFGLGVAAAALPGCVCTLPPRKSNAKLAVQLRSVGEYIGGKRDGKGNVLAPGAGLAKAFRALSAIGYKGVEFSGYYGNDAKTLKAMLDDNGLVACGAYVHKDAFGPDKIAETCEFNIGYGNNFVICPGDGNFPKEGEKLDDFLKGLVDYYNAAAANAAKYGCRVGLRNHVREFELKMSDGTAYWDYFFRNTDPAVCMEQDVGAAAYAGEDPCEQYVKYPHRSPTLCASEYGAGGEPDAILGGPNTCPVDWDNLVSTTERNGVEWYVAECGCRCDNLSAVLASYSFLKMKALV